MNIPDNILQAIADAACEKVTVAPGFLLACSEKEYPDDWAEEVPLRLGLAKDFLAAIAPHLAPAGVGEYTDEEISLAWTSTTVSGPFFSERLRAFLSALPRRECNSELTKACLGLEKLVKELKASQLGVLRPLAEAGLVPVATPEPEPAEEVPLGPEDCPPGSVLKAFSWGEHEWQLVSHLYSDGVLLEGFPTSLSWTELKDNWQINSSIPDTGRWDANAWRDCSKPAK